MPCAVISNARTLTKYVISHSMAGHLWSKLKGCCHLSETITILVKRTRTSGDRRKLCRKPHGKITDVILNIDKSINVCFTNQNNEKFCYCRLCSVL